MSVRLRLLLVFAALVAVTVAVLNISLRQSAGEQVRAFMVRGGMVGADQLVGRLERYYRLHGSWDGVDALLTPGGMMGGQGMMRSEQHLRLFDAAGNLLVDSNNASPNDEVITLDNAIKLEDRRGGLIGYLLVDIGSRGNVDTQPLIARLQAANLRASLIAGAIALLLAGLIAGQLVRPIRQLTRAAENMAAGKLDQRVPVQGNDELATLAAAFNHMSDSIQESEERRQAMTADIAHELRTPLAIQRAHLEAMQDGVYPLTQENLAPVLEQNELLARLVDDLRTLALVDAGELALERVTIDPALLVTRAIETFRPAAEARGVRLALVTESLPTCDPIQGDPLRIDQILANLINNALQHTPAGGQVTLELDCSADVVTLQVRDTGPGIAADALPRIFERFYRADKARSRDVGGSGLGLAIARQLAIAQGGSLTAANHPEGGAVFTLRLQR